MNALEQKIKKSLLLELVFDKNGLTETRFNIEKIMDVMQYVSFDFHVWINQSGWEYNKPTAVYNKGTRFLTNSQLFNLFIEETYGK